MTSSSSVKQGVHQLGDGEGQDRRPNMSDLPLELLLIINDLLDVSDRVCLSLCSRGFGHKLGSGSWEMIRDGDSVLRVDFLLRLIRDRPDYVFCPTSSSIQLSAQIDLPLCRQRAIRPKRRTSERAQYCFAASGAGPYYRIEFQHLQSVMARHRHGSSHGIALDALFNTAVQIYDHHRVTLLFSVEPRVISDELCLRVQQWIISDSRRKISGLDGHYFPDICCHGKFYRGTEQVNLRGCKVQHRDQRVGCPTCHPLLRCETCAIEFQIDFQDLGTRGQALIVTKWLNLGRGETPFDPKWRRHLDISVGRQPPFPVAAADIASGIRGSFERPEAKSVQSLTEENASLLQDNRYETVFTRCYRTVWVRKLHTPKDPSVRLRGYPMFLSEPDPRQTLVNEASFSQQLT